MRKARALAFAALLVSSSAFAQVSSLESDNAGPRGQDLNKVICEDVSRTGTRLDTRRVCKTVLEWQQLRRDHREGVETIQRQGTSVGCQEGQSCGG
ncbi:MAG TPA: hypothetical protein VF067_03095 [Sphingomicrobium sp.]